MWFPAELRWFSKIFKPMFIPPQAHWMQYARLGKQPVAWLLRLFFTELCNHSLKGCCLGTIQETQDLPSTSSPPLVSGDWRKENLFCVFIIKWSSSRDSVSLQCHKKKWTLGRGYGNWDWLRSCSRWRYRDDWLQCGTQLWEDNKCSFSTWLKHAKFVCLGMSYANIWKMHPRWLWHRNKTWSHRIHRQTPNHLNRAVAPTAVVARGLPVKANCRPTASRAVIQVLTFIYNLSFFPHLLCMPL